MSDILQISDGGISAAPARKTVPLISKGTPAFRRANLAVFAAGFSTFALLYCVQPLLPVFSRDFGVSAAESSLSVSVTTGMLAAALLVAGSLSESWGRKPMMVFSLFASASLTVAMAFLPSWHGLLLLRALAGMAFSGLPAIAMAYLSEEMDRESIGLAMGLYISGGTLGGMSGRLFTGVLADAVSWRFAVGAIGAMGLTAAVIFWKSLPPSRNFHPRPLALRSLGSSFLRHLRDSGLRLLFLEAFLLVGGFISVYNYIGYRLEGPPYYLSQSAVGFIFGVYLFGTASAAAVGKLSGRIPRRKMLWAVVLVMMSGLALTLLSSLPVIIAGIAVLTAGFFGAHSMLSGWVGIRAQHARAQASSLYLFLYYMGSSILGAAGGIFWEAAGWRGVAGFVGSLLTAAFLVSLRLMRVQPLPVSKP